MGVVHATSAAELAAELATELAANNDHLILVCGRYEGIDARVAAYVDMELSLGDFVLTGGELAALAVIDAVARLRPGVLGNAESARDESFDPIAEWFETLAKAEKSHAGRFQQRAGCVEREVANICASQQEKRRRIRLHQAET